MWGLFMEQDLSPIFERWIFEPRKPCTRRIVGIDGREKLQVRFELGLLQMEMTGRPDGTSPNGYESALDEYLDCLEAHRRNHGSDEGFRLEEGACNVLWTEGVQYYQRYICLMHLSDFEGVLRDTTHNLALLDLVRTYAANEEIKREFERSRTCVLMAHARSKGEICLQNGDSEGALEVVREGIEEIRSVANGSGDSEHPESGDALRSLEAWAEEIRRRYPVDRENSIEQIQTAVAGKRYVQAAGFGNRLHGLN